jgi:NADH-quinone oxidoreductase subunit L
MFAMLTLVLADNFLLMFVGWEGVGLCSYLLIGFWYHKPSAAEAGKKAFIVNRIGDFGFLLGMFFLFSSGGSLNYERLFAVAPHVFVLGSTLITTATLLLFLGATGKSAQIPLYVWLPDAMEGPTPVSALIHAATMVTAGVYMVARCHVLFQLAPFSMEVVAIIGAATALLAATIGIAQNDIKRVLAYSTVSQLGYMFFACGVGGFGAGIFHVMTHAFFKALLFLGAGSVIHGMSDEQDMRKMGGLAPRMPWTHGTMLVATLAIAGIFPFAGFFSKDEILHDAFASGHYGIWAVGLLGALLTAFYMFRLYILTFRGTPRWEEAGAHGHADAHGAAHDDPGHGQGTPHESPRSMVLPLVVLAVLSAVGGLVGWPFGEGGTAFQRWLAPVMGGHGGEGAGEAAHAMSRGGEIGLMVLSMGIALVGIAMSFRVYLQQPGLATSLRERFSSMHRTLLNKYWVDELYDATVVRFVRGAADAFWRFWDVRVVDGIVNGVGYTLEGVSAILRLFQTGFVGTYALLFTLGVAAWLMHMLRH